ncbi:MAG: SRPBCC family protein [Bryobacterales bacterium]|nr:SRPBCC family protein [Bryobacterales bacterium]
MSERENESGRDVSQIVRGLGWFSIGLGLAEILMPGKLSRLIGINKEENTLALLRFYGFRELGAGIGILSQPQEPMWLWSRVAGDVVDLSSLLKALNSEENDNGKLLGALLAVAGVTALDVYCAEQLSAAGSSEGRGQRMSAQATETILINREPDEVYSYWHNYEQLPSFMKYIESVTLTGEGRSHWVAKGPGGIDLEWDAETTEERPGQFLSWRSLPGADVHHAGSVRFDKATGGRGTLLRVEMQYAPPGGRISATLAKLVGQDPGAQIKEDLRRLKQVIETGEVVASDASIHPGMHPASPPERVEDLNLALSPVS